MDNTEMHIVRLITLPSEREAVAILSALKANGIEAASTGNLSAGFKLEAPGGVDIMVKENEKEKALAVIQEIKVEFSDEDWAGFDVGEEVDQFTIDETPKDSSAVATNNELEDYNYLFSNLFLVFNLIIIVFALDALLIRKPLNGLIDLGHTMGVVHDSVNFAEDRGTVFPIFCLLLAVFFVFKAVRKKLIGKGT
jgi:hypothetical protein